MFLQVRLRFVLGILLKFVSHVLVYRLLTLRRWREVVAIDAGLQCPLISIEGRAPCILGVRRVAPRTLFPDHLHIVEIESGCLGVRDVGLAVMGEQYAARRMDAPRPA